MENYDQFVSLGYVCNVSALIKKLEKKQKTMVFDHVAVPMWAVLDLIKNDFTTLMEEDQMKIQKVFDDCDREYYLDVKNYLRLPFKFQYERIKPKMDMASKNLMDVVKGKNSVLFVRFEEPTSYPDLGQRILTEEQKTKYQTQELDYLKQLSDHLMANNPDLVFKILFINFESNFTDPDHKIVGIKSDLIDFRDKHVSRKMVQLIESQEEFLVQHL